MKSRMPFLVALSILVFPAYAQQATQPSEVMMQSLFKRLAAARTAVLLDAASDNEKPGQSGLSLPLRGAFAA